MEQFTRDMAVFLGSMPCIKGEYTPKQLYQAASQAGMKALMPLWGQSREREGKRACYFSAEFLVGRMVQSNLFNLGLLEECEAFLRNMGAGTAVFEEIEDAALGNGGLGRLAACFLDSAASQALPLDGYGIRYRYGIFRQSFEGGFQKEAADNWQSFGDPWSVRREEQSVLVSFGGQQVRAIPYDMPIVGYGGKTINTLRLWQSEPLTPFDFELFNDQKYDEAVRERIRAEEISAVLYPNDSTDDGKRLRLKQEYFFSSASLQSILREYTARWGEDFSRFPDCYAIQLNDTHPVISIPELIRLLEKEHRIPFSAAKEIAIQVFGYTNHTIMAEALERWDTNLFRETLPQVYPYVKRLQEELEEELKGKGVLEPGPYSIIQDGQIHMARMAVFASHSTNGVARIHTDILKKDVLGKWYRIYPERFNNKTNGITQRRWLALANRELSGFITRRIGKEWITSLDQLEKLAPWAEDPASIAEFREIKRRKKEQLCSYIAQREGVRLNPDFLFDIQIKRLHEYKRQFLNALSILDLYFSLKEEGIKGFYPTAFLFGGKAAPGYRRAKGIIKLIHEIARLVNGDPKVNAMMQVHFVENYNVSYAEKLIPAADISEQISTAGTEASGTGNMKFMLNGAVTLGTLDGANVEIVEQAGEGNNYIFGATVEGIAEAESKYDPKKIYQEDKRIHRVLDSLTNGLLDDGGTGLFRELFDSILESTPWSRADQYYLLLDFKSYRQARLAAIRDYGEHPEEFGKKCFWNMAHSGRFSSDRTVLEYSREIWRIDPFHELKHGI